ncbi:hypothetical protein, partial [Shewanella chilikensis]|uniref:hypothetical protein n=1 Tax=Shewanella chilikensis TaxID=558541 RepID=UPI0030043404
ARRLLVSESLLPKSRRYFSETDTLQRVSLQLGKCLGCPIYLVAWQPQFLYEARRLLVSESLLPKIRRYFSETDTLQRVSLQLGKCLGCPIYRVVVNGAGVSNKAKQYIPINLKPLVILQQQA